MGSPFGPPTMPTPGVARLTPYIPHSPLAPQRVFLWTNVLEAFYGGSAGSSKSDALLMSALQFIDVPHYAALILRRTYKDLSLPGALLDRARGWLGPTNARYNAQTATWTVPRGGRLVFGYCARDEDVHQYQSSEFQFIGIDESTEHSERVYRFLFSRLRRPAVPCAVCGEPVQQLAVERDEQAEIVWRHVDDTIDHAGTPSQRDIEAFPRTVDGLSVLNVPLRMRTASNPLGPGHAFYKRRFVDAESRGERVFVPARLEDNPYIDHVAYEEALRMLDPVNWQRLRHGDWEIRDPGQVFDASKVRVADGPWPRAKGVSRCRYWDMASTELAPGKDPDWCVGTLLARDTGSSDLLVEDVVALRGEPARVERTLAQTAERDGRDVAVVIEEEPGSQGKAYIDHIRRHVLPGHRVEGDRATGNKELRIRTLIPVIDTGMVTVVRGAWNQQWLDYIDAYPLVDHDDWPDSFAGAHSWLTSKRTRVLV